MDGALQYELCSYCLKSLQKKIASLFNCATAIVIVAAFDIVVTVFVAVFYTFVVAVAAAAVVVVAATAVAVVVAAPASAAVVVAAPASAVVVIVDALSVNFCAQSGARYFGCKRQETTSINKH